MSSSVIQYAVSLVNYISCKIGLLENDIYMYYISCPECFFVHIVKSSRQEGFHLDLEDYLIGLLQLASELVSPLFCWLQLTICDLSHCSFSVGKFHVDLKVGTDDRRNAAISV
jgi:hypothetical protein